ncbi:MarR family winged helix-turn-helix transcriptional regulator [Brevundimonas vesicularis]|uniref:MarR family winged helix-turn-helix transcriptional regulator n=1 Tax=Brevundimonas vesicularis TaxID=41276 RepID=UPI0038D3811D
MQLSDSRARFGIRFSLLARRWRRALEIHLAASGLTDATWLPLVHLKETGGGLTQKQLALRVGVDGSSLVRVLDILERESLIERRRDAADARARLIHLTPRGEARESAIRAALIEAETVILSGLPDSAIEAMLAAFEQMNLGLDDVEAGARNDRPGQRP